MAYSIFLRPAAMRDLSSLSGDVKDRIERAIDRLAENARPPTAKKLVGFEKEWRLRVGNYCVLYINDDPVKRVTIARVAHRREAYR